MKIKTEVKMAMAETMLTPPLHKNFPLRISSVNVTKIPNGKLPFCAMHVAINYYS